MSFIWLKQTNFIPQMLPDSLELEAENYIHCIKALRTALDERLTLAINHPNDKQKLLLFTGKLKHIDKKKQTATVHLEEQLDKAVWPTPPQLQICLCIAAIQPERLEWAIEKATELGVYRIFIVKAKRSQQPYFTKIKKNSLRLQKKIASACEQSHNVIPPQLEIYADITEIIATNGSEANLILYMDCKVEKQLQSFTKPSDYQLTYLFVGPEGGWTGSERELFDSRHAQILRLKTPVLRTETACIAGITAIIAAKSADSIIYLNP
jgi:RsmE family RNA methyltransferase